MKKYDFALAWDQNRKERFLKRIKKECSLRRLKFLLINSDNLKKAISDLEQGKLKISFLVDHEADYNDPSDEFVRLCYAVKDAGGKVICDPDDAREAANKSIAHYDLVAAKIPTPYTIVVRNWEPDDFKLTKEELRQLGTPFIIKPASGFGQKGVIKEATGAITEIAQARHFNRGDNFLLQEKIKPAIFEAKQAWFRVYFLFGEIIPCWWNTETGWYAHVTLRQMYNYRLLPLARIISEIARITSMDFFSSEIAVMLKNKEKRFVAIDYVNDQPELNVRSGKVEGGFVPGPVPEVVEHIAERIVDIAWKFSIGMPLGMHRSIWLAKARTEDETI